MHASYGAKCCFVAPRLSRAFADSIGSVAHTYVCVYARLYVELSVSFEARKNRETFFKNATVTAHDASRSLSIEWRHCKAALHYGEQGHGRREHSARTRLAPCCTERKIQCDM